jgi:hypothetical protein
MKLNKTRKKMKGGAEFPYSQYFDYSDHKHFNKHKDNKLFTFFNSQLKNILSYINTKCDKSIKNNNLLIFVENLFISENKNLEKIFLNIVENLGDNETLKKLFNIKFQNDLKTFKEIYEKIPFIQDDDDLYVDKITDVFKFDEKTIYDLIVKTNKEFCQYFYFNSIINIIKKNSFLPCLINEFEKCFRYFRVIVNKEKKVEKKVEKKKKKK